MYKRFFAFLHTKWFSFIIMQCAHQTDFLSFIFTQPFQVVVVVAATENLWVCWISNFLVFVYIIFLRLGWAKIIFIYTNKSSFFSPSLSFFLSTRLQLKLFYEKKSIEICSLPINNLSLFLFQLCFSEKLLTSEGRELRRALFSLKQIFQEDKDLVHGFVGLGGLNCLVQIGNEADQNYQNYILRALGQVSAFNIKIYYIYIFNKQQQAFIKYNNYFVACHGMTTSKLLGISPMQSVSFWQ